ncbi:MAG: glycerol kinase GlpK [Methylacidiphilales bacterium]|nr:glycerol kinase GlpK [Candidatus Methylacidiphilales bacterium]
MSQHQQCVLVIDQGTSSSRAMLFSLEGDPIAKSQNEFPTYYPQLGWVEQAPNEIWNSVEQACLKVLQFADEHDLHIETIGITNQRETTIVWDKKTGVPIYSAIVWQDRRTNQYCETLKEQGHEKLIRAKTGLLIDPYFSATKIKWILDTIDGARQKAMRGELAFGTVDTYLMYLMSNGKSHVTDCTNASRTLLCNIHTGAWDKELLELFTIPESMLPTIQLCDSHFLETKSFGLSYSVSVTGCAGDQQAAAFGQMCFNQGEIKSTYGTGCFIVMNVGLAVPAPIDGLLTTIGYGLKSNNNTLSYALEGSIFNAGTSVQWLRDQLQIISSADEIEALVSPLADNGGVYFVPAFTGLGAPYWEANAKASLVGITRSTNKAHIARAALESVAYQTQDILTLFKKTKILPKQLNVDGGMTVNNWLVQFLADITDMPVVISRIPETTALGALYLAMLGKGFLNQLGDLQKIKNKGTIHNPNMDHDTRVKALQNWSGAISSVLTYCRR